MNLKTLSLIAASALLGVTGVYAQASGAASTGTSSNGTAETAAPRGPNSPPTTAKLTRGSGPTDSTMMKKHKHHRRSRRHHHHAHKAMMKSGTEKPMAKPAAGAQ